MLKFTDITVQLGGDAILVGASASLPTGARAGLVGRNGAGKSTLLKAITGAIEPDAGTVETPRGSRIGYIAQETPGGSATPFETVLAADTERARLMAEAEDEPDGARIGAIHDRLEAIDAYAAPARAARILAGLGFDDEAQHRSLSSFSGGWRMRVALAALLFSAPDLLLLDEPSNHLDLEAVLWLESFLRSYRGTLLIVSHERDLLNNVVDHILHLQNGKTTVFPGGYDAFERQWRERQAQAEALRTKQEAKRQKLQTYVDRWRYKAHTARQAQSRLKALARMEPVAAAAEDESMTFDFPSPEGLRPPLVVLEDAAVGYAADTPVLSQLDLRIDPDDRIALLGRNGNGKTTLARLISGDLTPMAGEVKASAKMKTGYFAQHQIEDLRPDETPLQHMTRMLAGAKPGAVRAQLGRFGFSGDKANLEVRKLSGGERARLALALITREAPDLLILDEPTNHLDVDAREALVQALNDYGGAVILVSHDRHLLDLTVDRLVMVDGGTARPFDGTLDDYRDHVLGRGTSGANGEGRKGTDKTGADKTGGDRPGRKDPKAERKRRAEARARNRDLRAAAGKAEREAHDLQARITEIDRALFDPNGYDGEHHGTPAGDLMALRGKLETRREAAEIRWLELSEAIEVAEQDGAIE